MRRHLRHIPNILSGLRLLAAPLVAFLILENQMGAALAVFALAGLSDALDGYLAKTFAFATEFGAVLDPAADKLLMLASFVTLALAGAVPWWLSAVVIGRDVAIVCGIAVAKTVNAPLKVAPLMAGKASTVGQVSYVALILALSAVGLEEAPLRLIGDGAVVVLAIWSLLAYGRVWGKAIAAKRAGGN